MVTQNDGKRIAKTLADLIEWRNSLIHERKMLDSLGIHGDAVDKLIGDMICRVSSQIQKYLCKECGTPRVARYGEKFYTWAEDGNFSWNGLRVIDIKNANEVEITEWDGR